MRGRVLIGLVAVVTTSAALALATSASADHRFVFTVGMSGGEEVPPVATAGTGAGTFTVDTETNELCFSYSFSGLSSGVTAAHIHGFAGPGTDAGILYSLPVTNPASGCLTYTEPQEANLLAGLTYINIHTVNFPDGEIRGQIDDPSPDPHAPDIPTTNTPTTPAPPSNAFALGKLKGKNLTLNVNAAGSATVDDQGARAAGATAAAAKNLLKPSTGSGGPGSIVVKLKLTKAATAALNRNRKLTLKAKITFTPSGGTAGTQTAKLKLKK